MVSEVSERERDEDERDAACDDRLRSRYDELRLLRETQPEREAAAARKALEALRKASDSLVASLRDELDECKENIRSSTTATATTAAAAAAVTEAAAASDEALAALRTENDNLRQQLREAQQQPLLAEPPQAGAEKIALYEMLTGLSLECVVGDVARCELRAPEGEVARRRLAFELHLKPADGDSGDLEYIPTDLSDCGGAALPEYLREPIIFERTQAPVFTQRLLSGVATMEQ